MFRDTPRIRYTFELDGYRARVETSEFRAQWAEWDVRSQIEQEKEAVERVVDGKKPKSQDFRPVTESVAFGPRAEGLPTPEFVKLVDELRKANGVRLPRVQGG